MNCLDLMKEYGETYRITWDECYDPKGRHKNNLDPWYMQIPTLHGHFYPHSETELGFATNKNGNIARQLAALPFTTVAQNGTDGMNLTFKNEDFSKIAEIVKPKKKRRLTPEQRKASIERIAKHRFQKKETNDV
jgi:hypothetical protein